MMNQFLVNEYNAFLNAVREASAKCSEVNAKLMDDSISDDDYAAVCRESRIAEFDYDVACRHLAEFVSQHADQICFE